MTLEHILLFNLALIVAILSPGPAFLLSIQTTLSKGRRAGFLLGLGLALMAAIWTGCALLGLETIFKLFPWAYTTVKTIGALYLLYVALQLWKGSRKQLEENTDRKNGSPFLQGIMVNTLNPKSVIFAGAVLVVIFPPNMTTAENLLVVLNHFLVEVIFYYCLALTMSIDTVKSRYMSFKRYIDCVASIVLAGFGTRLLLDR